MDLFKVPFSHFGSYMTLSQREDGLFLRSISGSSPYDKVFRVNVLMQEKVVPYEVKATETLVTLDFECGQIEMFFAGDKEILIRAKGKDVGIRFDMIAMEHSCNYVHDLTVDNQSCRMINCYKNWTRHLIYQKQGSSKLNMVWDAEESTQCELDFFSIDGGIELSIREVCEEKDIFVCDQDFDLAYSETCDRFESFMQKTPVSDEKTRRFNAYVQWSGVVGARGLLKRPTMFMSKNWMTNVWAWDHCFNALGLCNGSPELAWDQFMVMFDHQEDSGLLPDFLNDTSKFVQCCKPPIHGFTLSQLMKNMDVDDDKLRDIYPKLSAWSEWWYKHRDGNKNGLCEYWHGNDSGWDNGSVFSESPVMESADLTAFLVVQAEVLRDVATKLGYQEDAKKWDHDLKRLSELLTENFFEDNLPISIIPSSNEVHRCESLLPFVSLIAAKHLPNNIVASMLKELKSDRFLTEYGFASESPKSDLFIEDGYWRGAIWPPATCLMVYALDNCGEKEFAKDVAARFCNMVKVSGSGENFSALSGKALRDNCYTWSASIYNYFTTNFLKEQV